MLTLLAKSFAYKLMNYKKNKIIKSKRTLKRKQHRDFMVKMFGKIRYKLSWWIGPWALYAWNNRNYQEEEIPYQKFYRQETVANRYAKKLNEKYTHVEVTKVFNERKQQIGYMLTGKGRKPVEIPSNIVSIAKYKAAKVH